MDKAKIRQAIDLISEIVGGSGSWSEKLEAVLEEATAEERTNLIEFAGWFDNLD